MYLQRWYCIDERTGARFSVRVWLMDVDGVVVFHSMRVHGYDGKGGTIFHELVGAVKVTAALVRFESNDQLVKYLLRDDLAT